MSALNGTENPADIILASLQEALPSDTRAGDVALAQQATREIRQVLTKLSARQPAFRCKGISLLRVTDGEDVRDIPVAIRVVPQHVFTQLQDESYVDPPMKTQLNKDTLKYEESIDQPVYSRALQQANRRVVERYILRALDCDIYDDDDTLVWARDGHVQREDEALAVLRLQGLSKEHFDQIAEDVERLSKNSQKVEEALRLKKSV